LSSPSRRRPLRVYGSGREPDPRFSLANERTLLAYLRTALALVAASTAVSTLQVPLPAAVRRIVGVLTAATALVTTVSALADWGRAERALRHDRPLPSPAAALVLAVVVVLVSGVLAVYAVATGR
jgi:putative membrane protein